MFFANNIRGERIHIDSAEPTDKYYCPACGDLMVQKRGNINAHHFAHKSCKNCDPWYTGKLSNWHIRMQNHFKKSAQEVIIWNTQHTEYHIADIALQAGHTKYIIEFQHSVISQNEFITRSSFYMQCGYKLIWVFDFCENDFSEYNFHQKNQKRILIADDKYPGNVIRLVWPGHDRIRFLDYIHLSDCNGELYIVFHVKTGKGKKVLHDPYGYRPWETWEYIDPFHRIPCFLSVILAHDDYVHFTDTTNFFAKQYSEEEFYNCLHLLDEDF